MEIVNMHKAKTNLSELVKKVLAGERVIISKNNVPVVELFAYEEPLYKRVPGVLKGQIWSSEDCWEADNNLIQSAEESEIFPE